MAISILTKAILVITVSYLLGSISFALLIGKCFYGIDVRRQGSGNLGATNTFRVLGMLPGALVLILDVAKGFLAVGLASYFFRDAPSLFNCCLRQGTNFASYSVADSTVLVLAGFTAIMGHNWSIFLKFSGGKGLATSAGVLFALVPKIVIILILIWFVIIIMTRYVSLGSVIVSAAFPFFMLYFYQGNYIYVAFSTIASVVVIYKHKSNISRLLKGRELKFGKKS